MITVLVGCDYFIKQEFCVYMVKKKPHNIKFTILNIFKCAVQ